MRGRRCKSCGDNNEDLKPISATNIISLLDTAPSLFEEHCRPYQLDLICLQWEVGL